MDNNTLKIVINSILNHMKYGIRKVDMQKYNYDTYIKYSFQRQRLQCNIQVLWYRGI